jgi:hypothetical protein
MSRLTRGKEVDIAKGKISKTPLSNWDRRLEIPDNGHRVITKVRSRDEKGGGNNKQKHNKGRSYKLVSQRRGYDQGKDR